MDAFKPKSLVNLMQHFCWNTCKLKIENPGKCTLVFSDKQ